MENNKEKTNLTFNMLLLTIFFNIWFPKAGIKLSGIPLTVGNVLFFITFVFWILGRIKQKKCSSNKVGFLIIIGIFYFLIKFSISLITTGYTSDLIGYVIPLCVYPLIYFVASDLVDSEEKLNKIIKIIVSGFFFLALYSFLQYMVGIDKCAIPGLTVNYSDYKEMGPKWYMLKSNGTDISTIKMVSTYQNGNLFGISMILIYPLVANYFKNKNRKNMYIISLILFIISVFICLSRACWLGIVLYILFEIVLKKNKTKKDLLAKLMILIMCVVAIILIFNYIPSIANRFLETDVKDWVSMSGRTEGLILVMQSLSKSNSVLAYIIGPYGIANYYGIAYEMLPLSVFVMVGIIGLFLLYPVFFRAVKDLKNVDYICSGIRTALIIWLVVGCIECGYWLPPAALNLFLLIGIGYAQKNIYVKGEIKNEVSNYN